MSKINHALIMAAGRGIRMRPLTDVIPKAMIPHNGSTLIANGIEKMRKSIENIHITIGYKGELIAQNIVQYNVSSIFNTTGKGNAWWIYHTLLKNLNEPTFVLTCDNVTDIDFDKISDDYFAKGSPACMAVPVNPIKGLEGDYIFKNGSVITHLSREMKSDLYCSGIQVIHPVKINEMTKPVEDFNLVWSQLMDQKALHCSDVHPDRWFTVDNLLQLEELYQIRASNT
jgi:NDP-sugar pyrophosphorylase family protein